MTITTFLRRALISLVILCGGTHVSAALLNGATFRATLEHQEAEGVTEIGVTSPFFVVGPEVELPGFGFRDAFPPLPALVDVDFSDTRITLTLLIDQPYAYQEYISFLDVNHTAPPITGVQLNPETNWAGFAPIRLMGFSDLITVNLRELAGLAGQKIVIDVVPEPSGGALAAVATGLAAVSRRRKE